MAKMTDSTRQEKIDSLFSILGDSVPVRFTEKSFRLAISAFRVEEVSFRSLDVFLLGIEVGKKLAVASVEETEATETTEATEATEATEEVQPKARKKGAK